MGGWVYKPNLVFNLCPWVKLNKKTCSLTAEPTTTKLFTDLSLNEREIQLNKCKVCGEVFKDLLAKLLDSDSIKKQIIAHSCKSSSNLKYKCDECEFWGPNTLTMEVHMKRVHSGRFLVVCVAMKQRI